MKHNIARLAVALVSAVGMLCAATPGVLAIRDARIYPVSGPVIEKGTVIIRDGLIEAVGADVAVPAEAWVLDGIALHVYPGLIDALSQWGLGGAGGGNASAGARGGARGGAAPQAASGPPAQGPEDRPFTTSWIHARDLLQTSDRNIVAARNAGFTGAVIYPTSGIFAGQGEMINLAGDKPGEMVVSPSTGIYVALAARGPGYPNSLLGAYSYIRQVYLDAAHYEAAKTAYEKNARGKQRPAYDRALEGILEAPRVLLPASSAVDIDRMLRFAAELHRPAIFYGGHEAYRAVEPLRRSGIPVLINLKWPERDRDADPDRQDPLRILELRENAPSAPVALAKASIPFAFYSGGLERPADWRAAVKRAIDAGLSEPDALKALTLSPAEIYGVADRLGSIEIGKIANLVVTDGNIFDSAAKVKYIVVDGAKYEPVAENTPATPAPASEETP